MKVMHEPLDVVSGGNPACNTGYAMGSAMASAVDRFGRAFECDDGSF